MKDVSENDQREEELALINIELKRLRKELGLKDKVFDRLKSELQDITTAFNSRLTYFAQLQIISDFVIDPDFKSKSWRGFENEMRSRMEKERE